MQKLFRFLAVLAFFALPASAQVPLTGAGHGAPGGGALACSYAPITSAIYNVAYTGATPSASAGTPAYTFSETGTLPPGMSINTSTGVISGTDTVDSSGATYPGIQVIVTDSLSATANCGTSFTLTVSPTPTPTYTPTVGAAYWAAFASSYTASVNIGTASSDRIVVLAISVTSGAPGACSVTIAGVSATLQSITGTSNSNGFYYANVTSGSGSQNVVITCAAAGSIGNVSIAGGYLTGLSGGGSATPDASASAASTAYQNQPVNLPTITIPSGGIAIALINAGCANSSITVSWTNVTNTSGDFNSCDPTNGVTLLVTTAHRATAGSITMTAQATSPNTLNGTGIFMVSTWGP